MINQSNRDTKDVENEVNLNYMDNELEDNKDETKRIVPRAFVGTPLWDYDATGENEPSQETFLILSRGRWGQQNDHAYRFNQAWSLRLLSPHNPVRLAAIRVITNSYFEPFIIMTILVNCVFLAINNPPEVAEYVFTAIYTAEMVLKILAMGFVLHRYAYLRDPWNRLDFSVVILGYITLLPSVANMSGIRTFRLLRALRTISALKGLRTVVNTLLQSMKMLSDVMFLFFFFLCVMALIGLQLFHGLLRNKCLSSAVSTRGVKYIKNNSYVYMSSGSPLLCGNTSVTGKCPANYTCVQEGTNPNFGYTNFDNIGSAFLMAFQLLTMDFWENQYNKVIRAAGKPYVLYYLPAIFFGSFFLYNLVLAVVTIVFTKESKDGKNKETQLLRLRRTEQFYDVDGNTLAQLRSLKEHPKVDVLLTKSDSFEHPNNIRKIRKSSTFVKTFKEVAEERKRETSFVETVSCFGRARELMLRCVMHAAFDYLIMSFILMNTIVLALYHYGIDPSFSRILDILNEVFTGVFVIEMVLKLIALGPKLYVKSSWNIFDGIVVIVSVVDTIMELTKQLQSSFGTSVLRAFRLLRILRLAQSWKAMDRLLEAISKCLGPLGNITLILVLVIYIFAVLGTNLFGSSYTKEKFKGEIPRWNFKDFGHSFMLVFRVISGEWIEPLWDCMRATSPAAILFFLPAFILGNFLVLNLFLALLLDSFHRQQKVKHKKEQNSVFAKCLSRLKVRGYEMLTVQKRRKKQGPETNVQSSLGSIDCPVDGLGHVGKKDKYETRIVKIDDCLPTCCPLTCGRLKRCKLWLKFRYQVRCLVKNKHFERLILALIIISSFVLIFEDKHLPSKPKLQKALEWLNYLFCIAFTLEMLLKMIGFGVTKYFSSSWNCLDAFIVAISMAVLVSDKHLSAFRSLRTVRALRPLRALSRLEGMKVTINALFSSIPGIGNVLLVCLMFWLIFSILGVQLFAGKFYKCVDSADNRLSATIVPNKQSCQNGSYTWENSSINFDNVINGFLALFQVATFEGWMEVMKDAVDATGVGKQPKDEHNMYAYIYFVVFIIVGTFFVLNLFVGIIIDNFQKLKASYDLGVGLFLTDKQRRWVALLKEAVRKKPKSKTETYKPQNLLRGRLFDFVTSDKFEVVILSIVTLNMILLMMQHYNQPNSVTQALRVLSILFAAIFLLEAIAKLIAMGINYFKIAWNVFDFVIVVASIAGVVLDYADTEKKINPSILRVLRIFRIARLLKFVSFAKGVRQLVVALVISLPSLLNVGSLLFLIVFIYGIIGMSLFGNIKHQGSINDMENFEDFGNSLLILFRLTTSAGWNDVLESLSVGHPNCDPSFKGLPNGNCGNKSVAIVYLVSYVFCIFLIIVNMYIAILLENLSSLYEEEETVISKAAIDNFYDVWTSFAPNGASTIPHEELSAFVSRLAKPLTIPQPNYMKIIGMRIPLRKGGQVHVFDVMKAVVKRALERALEKAELSDTLKDFDTIVKKMEVQFMGRKKMSMRPITKSSEKEAAAITLQRAFRGYQRRKRLRNIVDLTWRTSKLSDSGNEHSRFYEDNRPQVHSQNGKLSLPNQSSCSITKIHQNGNSFAVENVSPSSNDLLYSSHSNSCFKQPITRGLVITPKQNQQQKSNFIFESVV